MRMLALGPTSQHAILRGLEAFLAAGWLSPVCWLFMSAVVHSGAQTSCSFCS